MCSRPPSFPGRLPSGYTVVGLGPSVPTTPISERLFVWKNPRPSRVRRFISATMARILPAAPAEETTPAA